MKDKIVAMDISTEVGGGSHNGYNHRGFYWHVREMCTVLETETGDGRYISVIFDDRYTRENELGIPWVIFRLHKSISRIFGAFLAGCIAKIDNTDKEEGRIRIAYMQYQIRRELGGKHNSKVTNIVEISIKDAGKIMQIGADELLRRAREFEGQRSDGKETK